MIEYILEVNMPNANNLLVRCENWGLGVFTAGDRGLSVLLCFFLPLQTLIQTVFPRSATAALTCVLINGLFCIFSAVFLPRQ